MAEWQLLSDLSFADLLLWVPVAATASFLCVAQVRPTTGPTAYQDDHVGQRQRGAGGGAAAGRRPARGGSSARATRTGRARSRCGGRRSRSAGSSGRPIAVVGRDTNLAAARRPVQLELAYLDAANDLCRMVCRGHVPAGRAGPRCAPARGSATG